MRLAFFLTLTLAATLAAPNANLFLEDTTQDDYHISNIRANYLEAYVICKKSGYTLAMERTEQETKIIEALIESQNVEITYFYLGGYNEATNFGKQWFWFDINEEINYDHWYSAIYKSSDCLLRTPLNSTYAALTLAATLAAPNANWFLEDVTQDDYHISNVTASYMEAYFTCRQHGFMLAVERTEEETKIIEALIESQEAVNNYFYLGGFNEITQFGTQWFWIDINLGINYNHWYSDAFKTSSCLERSPMNSTYGGKWTSGSCTPKYYFICQKAVTSTQIL
ncbi:hypothetical protein ABEB36_007226 [Hypothenemus hampei]|uniref:C-type lectin domain-containing protein n=1 Tax=Hypothenemus hampei TaxID=57062 RepID=A0ABD1ETT6_HYPHA